jgi:protein LTV1
VQEELEKGSDSEEEEESDEEDDEKKWDCATILSTYTNTDNHPAIVKTQGRVVRTKQRIELHKQFKVPLEGLMAEEISTLTTSHKKKTVKEQVASAKNGPYQQVEEEDDDGSESEKDESSGAAAEPEGGENNEKTMRKKQMKQEKRDKRKLKKELKLAFKSQSTKLVKATTTEIGAIRAGISIKKIY